VRLRDLASERELDRVYSPNVAALAFSPNGRSLAWAVDTEIRLREPPRPGERVFLGHGAAITSLAFSPDGRTLASGDRTPVLRLWNCATGLPLGAWRTRLHGVSRVCFSPDGTSLAAGGPDGAVQVWNAPAFPSAGTR
jgi:WD40 repeat protein